MADFLSEFKSFDPLERKALIDKATEMVENIGERPLKYLMAYLAGQESLQKDALVEVSQMGDTAQGSHISGRIWMLRTLMNDINAVIDGKQNPPQAEAFSPEDDE